MPEPCAHGREGEPDPYPSGAQDDRRYATRHNPFVYIKPLAEFFKAVSR